MQRIAWFVLLTLIRWIAIYPVDSVIQPLNNRALVNTTNTATIRFYKDGNYSCHAINQYGTDMKELQVNFKTRRFSSDLISHVMSNIVQCFRVSPT